MPKLLRARPPLDDTEDRQVRKLAGSRHAPGDWIRRAQMVARSWDGLRTSAIAAELGCHQETVRERITRFNTAGLDGLGDRPGAGRKPRLTEAERSTLVALARSTPPGRPIPWADGTLAPVDARPEAPAEWTLDGLVAAAGERGIVIKAPLEYSRGPDKAWVYGALRVRDGQTVTFTARSRNTAGYLDLLGRLDRANPTGDLYIIADNLSSHTSGPVQAWLAEHPRVHPVPLPVGACWLNFQEGWWRLLRKEAFAGQTFADYDDIERAVTGASARLNYRATPWIWGRPPPTPRYHRRRFTYYL